MPTAMTEMEAQSEIEAYANTDDFPALTPKQLTLCVRAARRRDGAGLEPTETGWSPSFDIPAGVAVAWRLKAANAAAKFDYSTQNQSFKRSQVYEQCLSQAAEWERRQEIQVGRIQTYEDITVEPDESLDPRYDLDMVRLV